MSLYISLYGRILSMISICATIKTRYALILQLQVYKLASPVGVYVWYYGECPLIRDGHDTKFNQWQLRS